MANQTIVMNSMEMINGNLPEHSFKKKEKMKPIIETQKENLDSLEKSKEECIEHFPKEVEEGNVEYKLKLINPTPERFQHLVSQCKWRLSEVIPIEFFFNIEIPIRGWEKPFMKLELKIMELPQD